MDKKVADSLMATALTGSQRRKRILTMMRQSSRPLSGGALGRDTGVSRQVVVQDIALLRTEGYPIIATARGYILKKQFACLRSVTQQSRSVKSWKRLLILEEVWRM